MLPYINEDESGNRGTRINERPAFLATLLFFLLFSGPPSLRLRDPLDSIEGLIDPSVMFQVSVWAAGGIWTLYQLRKELHARTPLGLADRLGLLMIFFLGVSVFVSAVGRTIVGVEALMRTYLYRPFIVVEGRLVPFSSGHHNLYYNVLFLDPSYN